MLRALAWAAVLGVLVLAVGMALRPDRQVSPGDGAGLSVGVGVGVAALDPGLVQAIGAGRRMTAAIEAFYLNTDRCPADLAELGLTAPADGPVMVAEAGETPGGQCTLRLTLGATPHAGATLLFTRGEAGGWACQSSMEAARTAPDCPGGT